MIQKEKEGDPSKSASQHEATQSIQSAHLRADQFHLHNIYRMIQKEKEGDPSKSASQARNESIRQMKYLRAAPFHSHKIYRTIQKEKEEDPSTSASQQEASQSGKLNTYVLLHSVPTRFTARFKYKRKKINSRQHRSKKRVNQAN